MPKLLPSTLEMQRKMVARLLACEPGMSNEDLAEAVGVEPSTVSKWTSPGEDPRHLSWAVVRKAAKLWGWDRVVGEDARRDGCRIESVAAPSADMATAGSDLKQALLTLLLAYERATSPQSDGKADISEAEWAELGPLLDRVRPAVDAVDALRPRSPQATIPFDGRGGAR